MLTLQITGTMAVILLGLSLYMLVSGYKKEAKFLAQLSLGSTGMILFMILACAWAGC